MYSAGYLGDRPQAGRFYTYLLALMASIFDLGLADNLLALFVFWELTRFTSSLLFGLQHDRAESPRRRGRCCW